MSVTLHVVDHPLAADALARLRSVDTPVAAFRAELERLGLVLLTEATRSLRLLSVAVQTPLATAPGARLEMPPVLVPVLRAGIGFLSAATALVPDADVGFVGMTRDERTHSPVPYVNKLPETLIGRQCIVLDPMLATGGSLAHTCRLLAERGADRPVVIVCALAAPEGLHQLESGLDDSDLHVDVFTAALDDRLDSNAFIVPGLGDAGDRLFGRPG
ncbi:MAG: uracil phosphoribosyltransferase [Ilumatobacteraceae bacterium]